LVSLVRVWFECRSRSVWRRVSQATWPAPLFSGAHSVIWFSSP
jgi:hypothetical protein